MKQTEIEVGLFVTRTSCHQFQSNQLRMLLAALGCVLVERLRALERSFLALNHLAASIMAFRKVKSGENIICE